VGQQRAFRWRTLVEHHAQPGEVRRVIETLIESGYDLFLEISPHPLLGISINETLVQLKRPGAVLASLHRRKDERSVMSQALAALHVHGRRVDWEAVFGSRRACVSLPTYPWQRETYRAATAPSAGDEATRPAGEYSGHPLLGTRIRSPHPYWEADLNSATLTYLQDHAIEEAVVFPAAAYIEMSLAAAGRLSQTATAAVDHVEFHKMMVLPSDGGTVIQLLSNPDGSFEIHSSRKRSQVDWTLNATGKFISTQPADVLPIIDLEEIRVRCPKEADVAAWYESFRGVDYTTAARSRPWSRSGMARMKPSAGFDSGRSFA